MGKRERRVFTDEFKQEAVRLIRTSGLTIAKVSEDLGVGLSTLTRWKRLYWEADLLSGPHDDVEKELAHLRKENELLRQTHHSIFTVIVRFTDMVSKNFLEVI